MMLMNVLGGVVRFIDDFVAGSCNGQQSKCIVEVMLTELKFGFYR